MKYALLLAGGTGSRLGEDIPKQYIEVNGKPVIAYCLETFDQLSDVEGIWIVADKAWRDYIRPYAGGKLMGFSEPGDTRQLSILNGLNGIKDAITSGSNSAVHTDELPGDGHQKYSSEEAFAEAIVLIHDAARPLVSQKMIKACFDACELHDGVMPALPMKDTVYLAENGKITSLLDRSRVIAGQAPEAFCLDKYLKANLALLPERIYSINGSSEPAIIAGMDIVTIPGDERNFKITTRADLEHFRKIIEKNASRNVEKP